MAETSQADRPLPVAPGYLTSALRVFDLSLTEIRHYGADTPQIARRMRALLLGLAEQAPAARRHGLDDHLARLDAAVRAAYPDAAERAYAETPDHLGIGGGHH